ncbi:ATP synthase subunit [Zhengella mangrovi]|uniref:ATP synthase subunit n=1 Tax=Zhengella mangrovi TaxID=1982044 RepID=A0A2G1QP44_9HYPH|nr:AtpZ/AtpI family protein [Zhengella mangrovi]PHP66988.1 ATP synthase subunit [Zhengella mangrovi]
MMEQDSEQDRLDEEARKAAGREDLRRRHPEPSLGSRLGQVGVLGWIIVLPLLGCMLAGRWLDRHLGTGMLLTGALTAIGASIGLWLAMRWMKEQK